MTEEEVLDFFEKLRSQRQELQSLIQERENVASDLASVKAVQYDKPKITVSANSDLAQVLEKIIERCDELDVAALVLVVAFIGVLGILVTVSICGGLG